MVFSSLFFLYLFLPLNIILYFAIKDRTWKNCVLIVSSLIFYAWGEPVWVLLLVFSATIDFFHGKIAGHYRGRWQSKLAVVSSVLLNLSLLGFFKYSKFFAENLNSLFHISIPHSNFLLPIGISFYTFQTISYVVDVYRGEVPPQKSYLKFLMFVSLFHQLVAGPIVRYKDIAFEIENRNFDYGTFSKGITRFVTGLAKKVIIANTAGAMVGQFLNPEGFDQLSVLGGWFGIFLFSLQIYFDFSGYSDMAIGLGHMFGFSYKENFNYPYIAKSATEFWRRWHISLGSFFRDYVYIPLGGNKKHHIFNIVVVWFLTGFWHGAYWNFIFWGLFYCLLLIIEKFLFTKIPLKVPAVFQHIYLLFITLIGWSIFYYTDLTHLKRFLSILFGVGEHPLTDTLLSSTFFSNLIFILIAIVASTPIVKKLKEALIKGGDRDEMTGKRWTSFDRFDTFIQPIINLSLLVISTILLVGESFNPFLYFRF